MTNPALALAVRRSSLPRSLAFVRDVTRRGKIRAVSVAVVEHYAPAFRAAAVVELRSGIAHVLPFGRMVRPESPAAEKRARLEYWLST